MRENELDMNAMWDRLDKQIKTYENLTVCFDILLGLIIFLFGLACVVWMHYA